MAQPSLILRIERLVFGGAGLARREAGPARGKVVLVKGGLPGELVRVSPTATKADYDLAQVEEVLEASPDRVAPPCPLSGRCGGCQLQHLAYPAQAQAKAEALAELLARGGVAAPVGPVLASPQAYAYRYRLRLAVTPRGEMGFRAEGSRRVTALAACPVATAEANALLAGLAQAVAARPPAQEVEVEPAALGESAGVVVRPQGRPSARLQAWVKGLAQALAAPVYLGRPRLSVVPDDPPAGSLELPWGRLSLALFPSVFGQAQAAQNQALIQTVLDLASPRSGEPLLDLMAGMGNLSLPLALAGAEVTAVELDPLACLNGAFNARRWGLASPFLNLDAAEALGRFRLGQFQTVILDPPRRGIKELLPRLAGLAPERLVYVSCQPAALARDLKALAQAGYRATRLVPLDLFPQTFHLETVALVERG